MRALEAFGTVAFFAFSFALAYIAISAHRFTRYGQEALLAAACFLFTAGLMRLLVYADFLDREQAVIVNSAAALGFVLIGMQLAVLRYVNDHAHQERRSR